MKNIVKLFFAALLVSGMAISCTPDDNHSMTGDMITDSMLSFTITPGSDEFTFNFAAGLSAANPIGVWSIMIDFGDDTRVAGGAFSPLQATHEFLGFAGEYFDVTAHFRTPNGTLTRTHRVTLPNDNVRDDPASWQYILTGGMNNTAGKMWQLGPWTSMRNPANRAYVWWNFFAEQGGQIQGDRFVFAPNSIRPNGGFTHILPANGGSFMNESLAGEFPDPVWDPSANDGAGGYTSWVTQFYVPPTDATWSIDGDVLVINRGFLGYAIAPSDLIQTRYRVLEFSPDRIRLVNVSTWDGWAFELVPTL